MPTGQGAVILTLNRCVLTRTDLNALPDGRHCCIVIRLGKRARVVPKTHDPSVRQCKKLRRCVGAVKIGRLGVGPAFAAVIGVAHIKAVVQRV